MIYKYIIKWIIHVKSMIKQEIYKIRTLKKENKYILYVYYKIVACLTYLIKTKADISLKYMPISIYYVLFLSYRQV